ncbi:GNAT family N-acetyltransferase [Cohnella sp. REN36]|uniref:GNAT family N-acetyltransferase n=1 Tax=Cohnella sp. REN36 TaxID=2887347 RepID=UPI001D150850|nr:GNAT family protein [Cohnella sp. REN36]MCC3373693.1 GNAT family N-acetyltransferase [Cohnella sp. REN36]
MTNPGPELSAAMQFESRDLLLRFPRDSDLDDYFAFLQDPEMIRLTGSQNEFTRDEIEAWIRKIGVPSRDRVDFLIVLKQTNELLGEVVLNEIDPINRRANIRIGIQGTNHRGKGYGTQALIEMLRYGFEELKLHRIELGVYAFNPRAIHVYEKIGFLREGVQRDALYSEGKFHDMILMAILEDEFRSLYERSRDEK